MNVAARRCRSAATRRTSTSATATASRPGDGSSDRQGYALKLQNLLGPHFGRAEVRQVRPLGHDQRPGRGARAGTGSPGRSAAYVLILYGTNDWQDQTCQNKGPAACFTIESLRGMIEVTKDTRQPDGPRDDPAGQPRAGASRTQHVDRRA